MTRSPVRVILWIARVWILVMILSASLSARTLFTKSNAIPALGLVSLFFMERELVRRFDSKRDQSAGAQQQQAFTRSRSEEVCFAFIVGAIRVIGGLFVLVAGAMGVGILRDMEGAQQGFGGTVGRGGGVRDAGVLLRDGRAGCAR